MRVKKLTPFLLSVVAIFAVSAALCVPAAGEPQWGPPRQQSVEPDVFITFSPALPQLNQEVVVSLAVKNGLPANSRVTWNVSGAPFRDAGVKDPNTASYAFTPTAPGTFVVTGDVSSPDGSRSISTLELVIASSMPTQGMGAAAPVGGDIILDVKPSLPRTGQEATFTLLHGGLPENAEVRWEISGGPFGGVKIQGRNKEICSFVPSGRDAYFVRASIYDAGFMMAEITLQFIPM